MNFALALVNDTTSEVAAVVRSDTPFVHALLQMEDHHVVYVGAFAHEVPPDGRSWDDWLRDSLRVFPDGSVHVDFGGPRLIEPACTMDAIAAVARSGRKIHAHVEAWLRSTMAEETCNALGLRRSIPISVMKALDRVRVARVVQVLSQQQPGTWVRPEAYSRREVLERAAQKRTDARLEKHHRAHLAREARRKG